jgi:hypothetical protein
MGGFIPKAKFDAGFFRAKPVADAAARANERVQSKFGAFTRRTMKSSIRYKTGVAPAGSPPYAHRSESFTRTKRNAKTGATTRQAQSPLRELIFFALDRATSSVVIGPVRFGAGGAHALEFGGTTAVRRAGRTRSVRIAPHPFARPAGAAEAKNLPELLRSSVR